MILTLFIGVQTAFAAGCLGTTSAIFVDGVSEYNYDPVWYPPTLANKKKYQYGFENVNEEDVNEEYGNGETTFNELL